MGSIKVLTINKESHQDLVKIVEDARKYFPGKAWNDVTYLGRLSLKYDIKIATSKMMKGAFLFERLTMRLREIKIFHKIIDLLIAITQDPIVAAYYFFDGKGFKRTFYLVHDYMDETIGIVSLFQVNENSANKVVAHGLGHSKGLRHHLEPIDLMHPRLLRATTLEVEGFCKVCREKLTRTQAES
jgi:predicted Zn-dependent protease